MSEVTQEMLEAGAEIWWQTREQPLYPRLEAAYRAMRDLEPESGAELGPNQFLVEYRPSEKINTPSPPQTRVPEASEDPG